MTNLHQVAKLSVKVNENPQDSNIFTKHSNSNLSFSQEELASVLDENNNLCNTSSSFI